MKIAESISLIGPAIANKNSNETWADLGCGSGTFTKALATVLGPAGKIYAVDKEYQTIVSDQNEATLQFIQLDFVREAFSFYNLDGILMANALHYVQDKPSFLEKIRKHLKPQGQMIIVEYDTERQNRWVPYPINFKNLQAVFTSLGCKNIYKIGERPSIYQSAKMYAASVS